MALIEGISARGDNRLLGTNMDINIADTAQHFKDLSSVVGQVQLLLNAYQLSASTHILLCHHAQEEAMFVGAPRVHMCSSEKMQ